MVQPWGTNRPTCFLWLPIDFGGPKIRHAHDPSCFRWCCPVRKDNEVVLVCCAWTSLLFLNLLFCFWRIASIGWREIWSPYRKHEKQWSPIEISFQPIINAVHINHYSAKNRAAATSTAVLRSDDVSESRGKNLCFKSKPSPGQQFSIRNPFSQWRDMCPIVSINWIETR